MTNKNEEMPRMDIQYWRVFYNRLDGNLPNSIDVVAKTADEAREKAKKLGLAIEVQDIAGLRPLDESQEEREVKTVWRATTADHNQWLADRKEVGEE